MRNLVSNVPTKRGVATGAEAIVAAREVGLATGNLSQDWARQSKVRRLQLWPANHHLTARSPA